MGSRAQPWLQPFVWQGMPYFACLVLRPLEIDRRDSGEIARIKRREALWMPSRAQTTRRTCEHRRRTCEHRRRAGASGGVGSEFCASQSQRWCRAGRDCAARVRGERALSDVLLVGPLEHLDRASIGVPPCLFLGTSKRGDRFNGHHQIDQLVKGKSKDDPMDISLVWFAPFNANVLPLCQWGQRGATMLSLLPESAK